MLAQLISALLKLGVSYAEAQEMPVPFALALLNNGRPDKSRTQSPTNSGTEGRRLVSTRRAAKES